MLSREQTSEDALQMWSYAARIKVLTEGGKDYANIELPYFVGDVGVSIQSIAGRTIEPNGTIVAFSGSPYDKLIERTKDVTYKAKVFTLPEVQVGSILEYRYKIRFSDGITYWPEWRLQSPLYTLKEHFLWRSGSYLTGTYGHVAWTSNLPLGVKVKETSGGAERLTLKLDAENIPAPPQEPLMPPIDSIGYCVSFYYTSVNTAMEYWTEVGKQWSKDRDKFIGPRSRVRDAVKALVSPGDSEELKVKKIYDNIMTFENTDLTRAHTLQEDKAEGDKNTNSTDDVFVHRRGTSDQLAELFVAMVRAAGLKPVSIHGCAGTLRAVCRMGWTLRL